MTTIWTRRNWRHLAVAMGSMAICATLAASASADETNSGYGASSSGSVPTIDFSAPAEDEFLEDGASVDIQSRAFTGRSYRSDPADAPRHRGRSSEREPDFRTFDVADGDEGGYWYHRTSRPERMERRGSFTIITLRSRATAVPEVTLVPPGVSYSSEAPGASGTVLVDVDSSRLDERGYGPDGLDIIHTGGAKIIRIAPDFDSR